MYGSGHRIAGIQATVVLPQTAVYGCEEIAPLGFCAAVLGTSILSIYVPLAAAGSTLQSKAAAAVSVLPGPFES